MGNAEIDRHIFACCSHRWSKVARITVNVAKLAGVEDKSWGYDAVTKRIRVLVYKHRLEAAGDLWKPRRSEVRLPPLRQG